MKKLFAVLFFSIVAGAYAQQRVSPVAANMALINGGTFTMGSPESELGIRIPVAENIRHQVTVGSFYMGKYQVTQKEYEDIMGTNPSVYQRGNHPVESVSWFEAVEYCNRLSRREGLVQVYTINGTDVTWNWEANGYRLPTEAEWEYACRAGTTTPFNTGNNITTDQANYNGNYPYKHNAKGTYRQRTSPVGSFAPNSRGLYDMHGNVWEWCWDWNGDYVGVAETDPEGPPRGTDRICRGGSWFDSALYVRSAMRTFKSPSAHDETVGFRLVRSGD